MNTDHAGHIQALLRAADALLAAGEKTHAEQVHLAAQALAAGPTEAQVTALLHSLDSLARGFDREYGLPVEWPEYVPQMHALVRLALSMEPGEP